jgi:hypothetical protein
VNASPGSVIYKFLYLLFEGDVHSAAAFFKTPAGPKCVAHMAWGNGIKPFYYDSLQSLRAAAYKVLQYALRHSKHFPASPASDYFVKEPKNTEVKKSGSKVILVTRRYSDDKSRMIHHKVEDDIIQLFRQRGYYSEVCCNFNVSQFFLLVGVPPRAV